MEMIGLTSMSLVCGGNRSGMRITEYPEESCSSRLDAATGNERRPTVCRNLQPV